MKKIITLLSVIIIMSSCSDSKTVYIGQDEVYNISEYGWIDKDKYKLEGVTYEAVTGNIVWSIIGVETVVAPVILTGYYLYEPIKVYDTALFIKSYTEKSKRY